MAVQKQAPAQIYKSYNLKKRVNNRFIPERELKSKLLDNSSPIQQKQNV